MNFFFWWPLLSQQQQDHQFQEEEEEDQQAVRHALGEAISGHEGNHDDKNKEKKNEREKVPKQEKKGKRKKYFIEMPRLAEFNNSNNKNNNSDYNSNNNKKNVDLDLVAVVYLSKCFLPIMLAFSFHSLITEEYTSWYSWFIGSLTGCVYTFGFILMTPQVCFSALFCSVYST